MVFMKRRIKMANKKKQTVEQQQSVEQQKLKADIEKARLAGQQDAWNAMSKFLKERMLAHFMNKNNEIAKELRDINEIISKNIT
jgi:hypothetical protein